MKKWISQKQLQSVFKVCKLEFYKARFSNNCFKKIEHCVLNRANTAVNWQELK